MREIKVGLLGVGSMGRAHTFSVECLPYFYAGLPFRVKTVAVCAKNIENARRFAELHGIPRVCESEDGILAMDDIDVIDVCTPNIYHYATVMKAIRAGKHILCEKPLTTNYREAIELAEAAEAAGVTAGTVFHNRYQLANVKAREIVSSGGIGEVISFRGAYHHSSATDTNKPAGWKQNRDICGGGVLFDLGSHIIDLIYSLGGEFESVSGLGRIVYPTRRGMNGEEWKTNADEAFYMLATLKNGATGTIEAGKIQAGANDDLAYEIYGTKGAVKFSVMDPNWLYYYDSTAKYTGFTRIECCGRVAAPGGVFPGIKAPAGWMRGHVANMYNFMNAVYTGEGVTPSFRDGAHIQAVMEAAYESAGYGDSRRVTVPCGK